jgi:hypothetical protein
MQSLPSQEGGASMSLDEHSPEVERAMTTFYRRSLELETERLMASRLMADALKRENDQLRDKIKALFDAACEARHECDGVSHKAFDILNRALRAAA